MAKKQSLSDRIAASNQKSLDAFIAPKKSHNSAPRRSKPIVWGGDSEVFDDLRYSKSAGGVWATFKRGGEIQYFYPCDRATAKEWLVDNADEVGEFFNSTIRE